MGQRPSGPSPEQFRISRSGKTAAFRCGTSCGDSRHCSGLSACQEQQQLGLIVAQRSLGPIDPAIRRGQGPTEDAADVVALEWPALSAAKPTRTPVSYTHLTLPTT